MPRLHLASTLLIGALVCAVPDASIDGRARAQETESAPEVDRLEAELEAARTRVRQVYARAAVELPRADDEQVRRILGSLPRWDELVEEARVLPEEQVEAWLVKQSEALAEDPVAAVFGASTWWVLLADLRRRAVDDGEASGAELLDRVLLDHVPPDTFAELWDARFLEHPSVRRFRAAHEQLAEARAAAERMRVPEVGEPPLATMIAFDPGRVNVGPFTGWVQELDERDNQRRREYLRPFHMDRHEVTRGQYLAFLRGVPEGRREELLPGGWKLGEDGAPVPPRGSTRAPLTDVSYAQATAYAESVGKRLPTEAEWDFAAQGGAESPRTYPWGDELGDRSIADVTAGLSSPAEVDAFPQDVSIDGVVGLAGNVAEMVDALSDGSDVGRQGPKDDEQVATRGGSYRARSGECVGAWRWVVDPAKGAPNVGFRCVMDAADYRRRTR